MDLVNDHQAIQLTSRFVKVIIPVTQTRKFARRFSVFYTSWRGGTSRTLPAENWKLDACLYNELFKRTPWLEGWGWATNPKSSSTSWTNPRCVFSLVLRFAYWVHPA